MRCAVNMLVRTKRDHAAIFVLAQEKFIDEATTDIGVNVGLYVARMDKVVRVEPDDLRRMQANVGHSCLIQKTHAITMALRQTPMRNTSMSRIDSTRVSHVSFQKLTHTFTTRTDSVRYALRSLCSDGLPRWTRQRTVLGAVHCHTHPSAHR